MVSGVARGPLGPPTKYSSAYADIFEVIFEAVIFEMLGLKIYNNKI